MKPCRQTLFLFVVQLILTPATLGVVMLTNSHFSGPPSCFHWRIQAWSEHVDALAHVHDSCFAQQLIKLKMNEDGGTSCLTHLIKNKSSMLWKAPHLPLQRC